MAVSKFLPTDGFKWIDPKEFDMNNYTFSSSKGFVLKIDLEYPKELRELHYPFAPDKMEIKKEMSKYKLMIPDFPTGMLQKSEILSHPHNFFDKKKYALHYENLQLYLSLGLKLKKIHRVLEVNQTQCLKPYFEFNTQKGIDAEKNGGKDGKALYKLMNNAVYK